jgi:hypothetical protein
MQAAKFKELLFIFPAVAIVIAARVLTSRRLCRLLVLRLRWTQDDFSIDGKRLQQDVVAVAILVHERGADIEPEVVLPFALDDGVRLEARLLRKPLMRRLVGKWAGSSLRYC